MPESSIIQNKKECYVCGALNNLQKHHIYFGNGRRKVSDKNGFVCYLCGYHHTQSNEGVHGKDGHKLDIYLKRECQKAYELTHTRQDFIDLIGRSYL